MEQVAEKQEKQKRGAAPLLVGMAVLGCLVLAVGLGVLLRRYGQSLNEKLFAERRLHLTEEAEHIADVLDETTQGAWHEVSACRRVLQTEGGALADGESLLRLLASMQDVTAKDRSVVLAFDAQGNYYASDGYSGVWTDWDALADALLLDAQANAEQEEGNAPGLPENPESQENGENDEADAEQPDEMAELYCRQLVAQLPHGGAGVYFLFVQPVTGVTLADTGSRVCYVAVALNSAVVQDMLSGSGYGGACSAYLADKDGLLLYQYTAGDQGDAGGEETLALGADLAAAVSEAPYAVLNGGSFEQLGAALREGGEETLALEFVWPAAQLGQNRAQNPTASWTQSLTRGQVWFAANAAVCGMGWNLVLFVPAKALGVGARDILAETIRFFAAASGIVLLALVLLVRVRRARRTARRARRQATCAGMRKSC